MSDMPLAEATLPGLGPDVETQRRAALTVCGRAHDAADARLILDALGLIVRDVRAAR